MRNPAFAGSFYSDKPTGLSSFISGAMADANDIKCHAVNSVSFVAPHAGYAYSGRTAAYVYKAMLSSKKMLSADTIVILGPNHTGLGKAISISEEDWRTPLGIVKNDIKMAEAIAGYKKGIAIDEIAHADEHSIEVQLPFLQSTLKDKRIVPICIGDQSIRASRLVSEAISNAEKNLGRNIGVIASSDFNHYESVEEARKKDMKLIGAIEKIDYMGLNILAKELDDSACGIGPITIAMLFALEHNAKKGCMLKYDNSGNVTGDNTSVVAYSSILFE